jgi:hypothetical protein
MAPAKVAFNPVRGAITPRQFGPMMRIEPRAARVSRSSSACEPVSLKPAEITMAVGTWAAAHSATRHGSGRRHDDGVIHRLRRRANGGISRQAQNTIALGIHRVNWALDRAQILKNGASDA